MKGGSPSTRNFHRTVAPSTLSMCVCEWECVTHTITNSPFDVCCSFMCVRKDSEWVEKKKSGAVVENPRTQDNTTQYSRFLTFRVVVFFGI